jgi:hypothetical protein
MTVVTRGLNMGIAEGLHVKSEQFARMVPNYDLSEGLAAWRERRFHDDDECLLCRIRRYKNLAKNPAMFLVLGLTELIGEWAWGYTQR